MTDRLNIDGWMVAEANLQHGYEPYDGSRRGPRLRVPQPGRVGNSHHRPPEGYADNYSDQGVGGTATITTSQYATFAARNAP